MKKFLRLRCDLFTCRSFTILAFSIIYKKNACTIESSASNTLYKVAQYSLGFFQFSLISIFKTNTQCFDFCFFAVGAKHSFQIKLKPSKHFLLTCCGILMFVPASHSKSIFVWALDIWFISHINDSLNSFKSSRLQFLLV